jgi:hypothetical protein
MFDLRKKKKKENSKNQFFFWEPNKILLINPN